MAEWAPPNPRAGGLGGSDKAGADRTLSTPLPRRGQRRRRRRRPPAAARAPQRRRRRLLLQQLQVNPHRSISIDRSLLLGASVGLASSKPKPPARQSDDAAGEARRRGCCCCMVAMEAAVVAGWCVLGRRGRAPLGRVRAGSARHGPAGFFLAFVLA